MKLNGHFIRHQDYEVFDMTDSMPEPNAMDTLKDRLSIIDEIVPPGSKIAYFGTPQYLNVGDLLIWKGAEAFFRSRCYVVTFSASDSYCKRGIARLPQFSEEVIILLQGGGNFGDLYDFHQPFRESILRRYPRHRVVVLPQTVHFTARGPMQQSARAFRAHRDVHVFARDESSLRLLRSEFIDAAYLCPDMAHFLWGSLDVTTRDAASQETLYLLRQDKERQSRTPSLPTPPTSSPKDWGDLVTTIDRAMRYVADAFDLGNHVAGKSIFPAGTTWSRQADRIIRNACRDFLKHNKIVTSRLHGHILACLLGLPVDLIDNSYGKNSAYYDCWTHAVRNARLIDRHQVGSA